MAVELQPFAKTPVDDIPRIVSTVRSAFFTQKTKSVEFRLLQLRKLYWAVVDHEAEILEACRQDLGKGYFETQLGDVTWVQNDILLTSKNLEKWVKDEKPADIPISHLLARPRIRKDPLGCVLIIGAFNYPFQLSICPLVGAIAAGNTAILKPSEQSPASAAVMQKIIAASLDPSCYTVVQGGVPETQALLAERWDKIFFTGSMNTGKIVAKAAAANLTPVALELGGRNPAFVTKKANIRLAARRLLWTKVMNVGQVCISPNYILADKDVVPTLVAELKQALDEYHPKGSKNTDDYGRIVNDRNFARLKKMLDDTRGKIVIGGAMDAEEKYIEPTVIEVSEPSDSLIANESFGPFLPILPVTNLDEAISIANSVSATPLVVLAFGSKEETDRVLLETRSGGASINDGPYHGVIGSLRFGGVGESGTGAYRGKNSFDEFVHRRSITTTPSWMEKLLAVRYPPYEGKFAQFKLLGVMKPDFDRNGKVTFSMLKYILTLGTGSTLRGVFRAALLAVVAVALKAYMEMSARKV